MKIIDALFDAMDAIWDSITDKFHKGKTDAIVQCNHDHIAVGFPNDFKKRTVCLDCKLEWLEDL